MGCYSRVGSIKGKQLTSWVAVSC